MGIFSRAGILSLAVLLFISASAVAQPVLPDIAGATNKGINVISWTSQYEGIKSIAVQRSSDSVYNYSTVGYVKNLKKGPQAFIDGHPLPGNNWYKLYIVFNSDLTWYSNRFKLYVDSATLMNKGVLPPNDSLQKLAAKIKIDTSGKVAPGASSDSLQNIVNKLIVSIPDPGEINAYTYIRSQYVFTNPFTGHINMELPDPRTHLYSISFFDDKNRRIIDIPRILESSVILDKRNFQRKGLYKFELLKDNEKMETGYITVY
jgi:hypothetical protein